MVTESARCVTTGRLLFVIATMSNSNFDQRRYVGGSPLGTTTSAADALGLGRLAAQGTTLVYGIQYFHGVRSETGSIQDVVREYAAFRRGLRRAMRGGALPFMDEVRADHAALLQTQGKYGTHAARVAEAVRGRLRLTHAGEVQWCSDEATWLPNRSITIPSGQLRTTPVPFADHRLRLDVLR